MHALLVCAALATQSPSSAADGTQDKRPLRIAVYDLAATDIEPRVARVFVDSLLAELRKLQRASVLSLEEVRTLLDFESQKQLMGCTESSCLAEIAEALGADALVVGGMAKVDGRVALGLKRIDARTAEVVGDYTQQLTDANGEELLAAVGPAVAKMFADVPLRAGAERGVAPEVALRLNPPPVPAWAFYTAAGATAVGLAATALTGWWWFSADSALQQTFVDAKTTRTPGQRVKDEQAEVQRANAVFWIVAGVTGALAVTTGVMVPFTDFRGLGEDA
jgi:hypothetical protein